MSTIESILKSQSRLGKPGFDKIAIIGSAPASVRLGPYNDSSWAVWGCSPGVYGQIPKPDCWFELHRWEPCIPGQPNNPAGKSWFSPEYVRFMEIFDPGIVFLARQVASVKNGVEYPFEDMITKYGPYFFTSSMSWMLALAIELKPKAIGLWGVDMSAHSEYAFQRPGCQHFIGIAKSLGINIVLPPESDLLQPPTLYGISEYHPRHTKLLARMAELQAREQHCIANINAASAELAHIRGALDNLKYIFETWVDDIDPGLSISMAISHAALFANRPDAITAAKHQFDNSTGAEVIEIDHASIDKAKALAMLSNDGIR